LPDDKGFLYNSGLLADEAEIRGNIEGIRRKIDKICRVNGADPAGVTLLGVTKYVPIERIEAGLRAGLTDLGENKVQEASEKISLIEPRPRWHLIGSLQKNKVKKAVELFDIIESVDSLELAAEISRRAQAKGKRQEILLQVNSSNEETKHGFDPGEISGYADTINEMPDIDIVGLMTMGPLTEDEELIKKSFEMTRIIFDKMVAALGGNIRVLSMGMSGDFEIALDYGANELRIGTAIFGSRQGAK